MATKLRVNLRSDIHDCYLRLPSEVASGHDRSLALLKGAPAPAPLGLVFSLGSSTFLGWCGHISDQPGTLEMNAILGELSHL